MTSIQERVNSVIDQNKVAIFSETQCPNSRAVKKSLSDAGIAFHAEDIDRWDPSDKKDALHYLEQLTGAHTVPRVFVDGRSVGGNKEFHDVFVHGGRMSELRGA